MSKQTSNKSSKGTPVTVSRTRNFACVVYPESAPDNWIDILIGSHVPCFVSPLHDKDINPCTKETKKPHFHVQLMYDGPKTKEQVAALIKQIGGVGCEVINSARGMARYLCHLDNPEKAQYSIDEVRSFGGADYVAIIGTMADKMKAIREMVAYIEENDIVSWSDLVLYSMVNRSDWFDALTSSCAYFTKEYIKSRTWKLHHTEER